MGNLNNITYLNLLDRYQRLDVPKGIYDWAYEYHKDFLDTLYHPNVYIFPLTEEGEDLMGEYFKNDLISHRYGSYVLTDISPIDGEYYNVVIENND